MSRFFGWKLRKHIDIPIFYSGQWPISSDKFSQYILFRLHIFLYILAKIFWFFEYLWRNFYLRRSLKIIQNSEESLSSSLVFFLNLKILRLPLRSIFNLRCNTGTKRVIDLLYEIYVSINFINFSSNVCCIIFP